MCAMDQMMFDELSDRLDSLTDTEMAQWRKYCDIAEQEEEDHARRVDWFEVM